MDGILFSSIENGGVLFADKKEPLRFFAQLGLQ